MPISETGLGKVGWYDEYGDRFISHAAYVRQQRVYATMWLLGKIATAPQYFYATV